MRKQLTVLVSAIFLISSATALTASIDQNPPEDIVLEPENDYEVTVEYSSSTSTGDIKSREWNLLSTAQTDSGVNAEFDFSRGSSTSNTVRLTVSDGNTTDVDEVSQTVTDVPNASISAEPESVEVDETVQFTSTVTNEFGNIESYTWKGDIEASGPSTEKTFSSSGTKSITLQVNDSQGNSYTTDPITVDVSAPEEEDETSGGGGGGGAGLGALPQNNETEEENKSKGNKPETPSSKRAVAKPDENGVAEVNIQKAEGTKTIDVKVETASGKTSVKNIRISSDTSGQVSVSVRDAGREKPEQVPEPAASEESSVYSYQEINTSINDSEVDVAEVDFSVNRSWLEEKNRSTDEVVMKRYSEGWQTLQTDYINSTEEVHNFEASSTGFSYYSVALEEQEEAPAQENNTNTTDNSEEDQQEETSNLPLVLGIAVLLLVALLAFYRDRIAAVLGGNGKRQELEAKLEEIEHEIEEGRLEEADMEEVLEKVERASSLIKQERFQEAEEVMEEVEKIQ